MSHGSNLSFQIHSKCYMIQEGCLAPILYFVSNKNIVINRLLHAIQTVSETLAMQLIVSD